MNKRPKYYCIVPLCKHTSFSHPQLRFFSLPREEHRRDAWFKACRRPKMSSSTNTWVCEAHFDLEEDCENYLRVKLMNVWPKLKNDAVPSKFECQEVQHSKTSAKLCPEVPMPTTVLPHSPVPQCGTSKELDADSTQQSRLFATLVIPCMQDLDREGAHDLLADTLTGTSTWDCEKMNAVKSESSEQAEDQSTSENSNAEPTRPSLKRKYEDDSSQQPQCRVLQIVKSEVLSVEKKTLVTTPHEQPSLEHNLLDTIKKEVPFEEILVRQEPSEIKHEPEDTILQETDSESIPRFSSDTVELKANEYFKIVDVQDILQQRNQTESIQTINLYKPPCSNSVSTYVMSKIIPFQCGVCKKIYISNATLKSHVLSEHNPDSVSSNGSTMNSQSALSPQMKNPVNQPACQNASKPVEPKGSRPHYISLLPKPSSPIECSKKGLEAFYAHFCKFHLKFNHSTRMNILITMPHLIQSFKPQPNSTGQFQCPKCLTLYAKSHSLELHLNKDHPDSNLVQCKICDFVAEFDINVIAIHVGSHKFYKTFVEPGENWLCIECKRLSIQCLRNLKDVRKYTISFHFKNITVVKNFSIFQYTFNNSILFYRHERSFFKCTHCMSSDTFETQDQLHQHLESHVEFVFRKCSLCETRCDNMNDYYDHILQTHGSCLMDDIDFRNKKAQFHHQITKNNLMLHNSCSLKIHVARPSKAIALKNHFTMIYDSKKEDIHECPVCNVVFLDEKLYYSHCVPYTKLYAGFPRECIECSLKFSAYSETRNHWKQVHSLNDSVSCKICKVRQNSITSLENHVTKQHNVSVFHCNMCKTNILVKNEALAHFKSCYSKVTHDFVCPICAYICDDFEFLIDHLRIHLAMPLPQYQCKVCLNFFHEKFNLASHLLHGGCD